MNVEANGKDMNDPAVMEERVSSFVSTLLTVADPRVVTRALLGAAAELSQLILRDSKATHGQIAVAFTSALTVAVSPPQEAAQEESRIEVVPAGVIDLSKRR